MSCSQEAANVFLRKDVCVTCDFHLQKDAPSKWVVDVFLASGAMPLFGKIRSSPSVGLALKFKHTLFDSSTYLPIPRR